MAQRSIDILFKDKFAGILIETANGGTCFIYNPEWTEDIACCLPSTHREHEWRQGFHPFFQHLGTEGWLREQQARIAHIVEEDDLGLLLRYGADCIGAVSVRQKEADTQTAKGTEAIINPGRTISGVQKKLLVVKDKATGKFQAAPASGPAPYIAKFNPVSGQHDFVLNEYLSLRWTAAVLGENEVTKFCLSDLSTSASSDARALVVTRFDRNTAGEKFRLEDCAQILCKPRGQDYAGKYNAAYEDVAAIITQYSVRPVIDLARFYRRLIVSTLIGNCDAHLKNFSLLESPSGLRLSPAYDIVNTAVYGSTYDRRLALSIGGKKIAFDEADSALFLKFGREIGLPNKVIEQIFTDLRQQTLKAAHLIRPHDAEEPDSFKNKFEEIVRNSCLRILKE